MIKKLLVFVVILTVLVMHTGTAFAESSAAGKVIGLEGAHGGLSGTVFIFKVSGEFSGAELQGSVQLANGTVFTLYCAQLNAETVRCLTSSRVWGDVIVTFAGVSFATHVGPFERVFSSTPVPTETEPTPTPTDPTPTPTDPTPTPTDVTPTPTDVTPTPTPTDSNPTPTPTDVTPTPTPTEYCYNIYDYPNPGDTTNVWTDVGDQCQPDAATVGQGINYFNPGWYNTYYYEFMLSSPNCGGFPNLNEDAFYYVC